MQDLNTFLKKYTSKVQILETKNKNERSLVFLNIKMSAKPNKIELSEEFMVMWREKQTLWDVMSTLH